MVKFIFCGGNFSVSRFKIKLVLLFLLAQTVPKLKFVLAFALFFNMGLMSLIIFTLMIFVFELFEQVVDFLWKFLLELGLMFCQLIKKIKSLLQKLLSSLLSIICDALLWFNIVLFRLINPYFKHLIMVLKRNKQNLSLAKQI